MRQNGAGSSRKSQRGKEETGSWKQKYEQETGSWKQTYERAIIEEELRRDHGREIREGKSWRSKPRGRIMQEESRRRDQQERSIEEVH